MNIKYIKILAWFLIIWISESIVIYLNIKFIELDYIYIKYFTEYKFMDIEAIENLITNIKKLAPCDIYYYYYTT